MDTLTTILDSVWIKDDLNLSHKKFTRSLIQALILTLSVNLIKLAHMAFSEAKTLSTVRRIERLLAISIFKEKAIGKAIVKALPPQKKYILTMDRTVWELGKRVYNILAIGICYNGISIPIHFTMLEKRGATNFAEQKKFMEDVFTIIPADKIACLVADREFGYVKFVSWLTSQKVPYCLRIRENSYVTDTSTNKSCKVKNLLHSLAAGQSVVLNHSYRLNNKQKIRIYAVRRAEHDRGEDLIILATPEESNFTDKIYRLRWQIETAFRAMKSAGFNMEETHLPLNGRFENMLRLIFIAYACAFIEGLQRMKENPIPIMKKNGRRRFSIFSWGLDWVYRTLLSLLSPKEGGGENEPSKNCHVL